MAGDGSSIAVDIELHGTIRPDALLFGESQSRILLSLKASDWPTLEKIAASHGVPLKRLGTVGGTRFRLRGPTFAIDLPLTDVERAWRDGLASALGG